VSLNDPLMGLTFRPARPEDKQRMLEITARTWGDDGDYVPEVWDRWLVDPKGEFTVAEFDGVVVALAKLTWQGEGHWWLEGLRVDPERRLKGVGQAMCDYQIELTKKLGGGQVRYMTGIHNDGSHRIAAQAGFRVLARFVERVAEKLDGPVEAEVLTHADLDAVWSIACDLGAASGVYVYGWKAFNLTRERLADHLSQGQVMGVRDHAGSVRAWCLFQVEPDWDRLGFTVLYGTAEGITKLARAMRTLAAANGKGMAEVMTPPHPPVLDALAAAGYHLEVAPEHLQDTGEHGADVLELVLGD